MIILYSCLVVFLYMSTLFIIATLKRDNSIVDSAWGIGFIILSFFNMLYNQAYQPRHFLAFLLVAIWGIRLSIHIYLRNKGKGEDPRYKAWREQWGTWVVVRSFFQVFMLQGVMMLLIASPLLVIFSCFNSTFTMFDVIGPCVWLIGFLFETVGDYQLSQFLNNPKNHGHIMTNGLWRYTRHPNYFGEVTLWWGIFILALACGKWYISIISPLTITTLILFVSGIPMTERMLEDNKEYRAYKKKTNMFFPGLPKT